MKEEKKKMELDAVLKDNKRLDGQLLNMEAEIVENDRKQKYYTILKVMIVFGLSAEFTVRFNIPHQSFPQWPVQHVSHIYHAVHRQRTPV